MAQYRSCIVAHGARTAVGLRGTTTAAAVRAGISRLVEHPRFYDSTGEPFIVGRDRTIEEFDPRKRMLALGVSALEEALEGLSVDPHTEIPVFVGVRETALGFTNEDAAWLATAIATVARVRCRIRVSTVTGGNAAGLLALALARRAVEMGEAQLTIAGGVDSHINPTFLEQLDDAGRCKSIANKWGYPPGEAAAMLAVCSAALARHARIPILAGLVGEGHAVEPARLGSGQICLGVGLAAAITSALQSVPWPTEVISAQYCDINGEFYRTDEFLYATQRLPAGSFRAVEDYIAPADCCGDVGAASGPLFAVLAIESGRRAYARGNLPLLWAGSENGQRAAAVLELPGADGGSSR